MLIRQRRIMSLERYLPEEYRDQMLVVALADLDEHAGRLERVGFTPGTNAGETVLPAVLGPISRYNAEGKNIILRNREKEVAYRQVEWHWKEYHGKDQVERSGIRDVPYLRYPREFVPPPSLELTVATTPEGKHLVRTTSIRYDDHSRELLRHAINLCLELFGECRILTDALLPAISAPVQRLNWRLLPPGRYPWERLRETINPIVERSKKGKRGVISSRLQVMNDLGPEFHAIGQGGFLGYVVFGFPSKNLFVLESTLYGNATYVFEEDWEQLSRMSKAQILDENLQRARIVHREGWVDAITQVVG